MLDARSSGIRAYYSASTQHGVDRSREYADYARFTFIVSLVLLIVYFLYVSLPGMDGVRAYTISFFVVLALGTATCVLGLCIWNSLDHVFVSIGASKVPSLSRVGAIVVLFVLYELFVAAAIFCTGGARESYLASFGLVNIATAFGVARGGRMRLFGRPAGRDSHVAVANRIRISAMIPIAWRDCFSLQQESFSSFLSSFAF